MAPTAHPAAISGEGRRPVGVTPRRSTLADRHRKLPRRPFLSLPAAYVGRPPGNAHGEIVAIDTAAALAAPGVVTVWTSRDTADLPPIGLRWHRHTAGQCLPADALLQPALARERDALCWRAG